MSTPHVIVVGGGLAGLTTAALAARGGARVTVFEKSGTLGGRAQTQRRNGWAWNLGPHALYAAGAGAAVLQDLGITLGGKKPPVTGYALLHGQKHTMPGGPVSLLTTRLLGVGGKLEAGRLLAKIPTIDPAPLARVPVREWLDANVRNPTVRELIAALIRLSTYANGPEQSAGAALANVQIALRHGVRYLDGGWQTMVDALRAAAVAAGATVRPGARVTAIRGDRRVTAVETAGDVLPCDAVVVAAGPDDLLRLCPSIAGEHRRYAETAQPVRAACLDVSLRSLPDPLATFGLGIDAPLYFSVHSASAALAPAGGAVIHVAKYLPVGETTDPRADQHQLEGLLDLLQPGWRSVLVEQRFLPQLVVAHAMPAAATGGTDGRPSVAVAEMAGLYVAGDWVGPHGLLADASFASAADAARRILASRAAAA